MRKLMIFLIMFLIGCEVDPNISYDPEWNIFFVLRGHGESKIVLDRTHKLEQDDLTMDSISMSLWNDDGDSIGLTFDSLGTYRLYFPFIKYGSHYYLRIYERHLGELHGNMVMPDTFTVFLNSGDTITSSMSIKIRCGNVSRFRIYAYPISDDTLLGYNYFVSDEVDSDIVDIPLYFLSFLHQGEYMLIIQALDRNYADYISFENIFGGSTDESYGIDNGVGVFGGISEKKLRVYLK